MKFIRYRFYINGWEESESYFMRICEPTRDELDRMAEGEIIYKDGNRYYIVSA